MIMRIPDPLLIRLPCSSPAEQGIYLELEGPWQPTPPLSLDFDHWRNVDVCDDGA